MYFLGVIALLRSVQTQGHVQTVASVSALVDSAPPFPTLKRLYLAECGGGTLQVLEEAALMFAANRCLS